MATEETKQEKKVDKTLQNPATGAGTPPEKIDEEKDGIMAFAKVKESLGFKQMMSSGLTEDGKWSLHDYLTHIMKPFYHQMYYIPNLRNNKCIVVKPETFFVNAPSCNVIYPNMKSSITWSRPFKEEPTRLLQITDPIAMMANGQVNQMQSLHALVHVEENLLGYSKYGMPIYKTMVKSNGEQDLTSKVHPMSNLSNFEKRNGIRTSCVAQGADLYLYLTANKGSSDVQLTYQIEDTIETKNTVGNNLARLARYELCRQRYMMRNGSVDMYFNPYIVPGFPMVSIESSNDSLNIYGYVTNVVHNLTDRSWTTTIGFTAAHTDDEQTPGVFPIIESEYASKIRNTYTNMLGTSVVPVGNEILPEIISQYNQENTYITQSYRKVWRETPTLASYLAYHADGATVTQEQGFTVLVNNPSTKFFDEALQERLKNYSRDIATGKAFALEDVN